MRAAGGKRDAGNSCRLPLHWPGLAWPHFPLLTSPWPLDGCSMQGSMTHSPDTLFHSNCRFPALWGWAAWAHAPPRTCPARSHATATSHDSLANAVAMPTSIHAPQACAGGASSAGEQVGHTYRYPVPQHPMLTCLPVFMPLRSALMLLRPALRGNTCAV